MVQKGSGSENLQHMYTSWHTHAHLHAHVCTHTLQLPMMALHTGILIMS